MKDIISIRGAKVHNLKNIDVDIPKNKFIVITGLSGSGKSSLAFDTIYAEGQRRYVESLSAYARQFLGAANKSEVEKIEGLSPAISIDQRVSSRNPRSTVGTITEIYDYLRLLYAKIGQPHCPQCGGSVTKQNKRQILEEIAKLTRREKFYLLVPLVREQRGELRGNLEEIKKLGYTKVRLNSKVCSLEEALTLAADHQKKNTLEVVVNDASRSKLNRDGLRNLLETALDFGNGLVMVYLLKSKKDFIFSERFFCSRCGVSLLDFEPSDFSFNSPRGACPTCTGLGTKLEIEADLIIPNRKLSIAEGAIRPLVSSSSGRQKGLDKFLEGLSKKYGFSLHDPVEKLTKNQLQKLLYGSNRDGIIPVLEKRYLETDSDFVRSELERYMRKMECPTCRGKRLRPESLNVTVAGQSMDMVVRLVAEEAENFFKSLLDQLNEREKKIAQLIVKEVLARLSFLKNVGLGYIALGRGADTLSGGEAQRVRLATQIGSGLSGLVYVLDEPSIGLHQRDNDQLIKTLKYLRDLGNTVIVVEHDLSTILAADEVIDMGLGAGENGGQIVAQGSPEKIKNNSRSITGQYLSGKKKIVVDRKKKRGNGKTLEIIGAEEFNLKGIDVKIPLGKFVCVTGVSGSGKSTLVDEILGKALAHKFYKAKDLPGQHKEIKGIENIDKVIRIDQSPIGRTPRSNPATYTGIFTYIRDLFTNMPESKMRGYRAGQFSFNVKGGRCEACQGDGLVKIEMHFLPDVYVECEECQGTRYNNEALEIHYKDKNIADVLKMSVDEALNFFKNIPALKAKIKTLSDVGLGYLQLGQPATNLSGGEAQRIKLATELSRRATGKTLYILDEPTTGLHLDDIKRLLNILNQLVSRGNTILVIEHNLEVIKTVDWVIDLGPEGGEKGGYLVAEGTPEDIAKVEESYTGQYLKKWK